MGRALARLLRQKRREFPFTITGIHTLRHGTAVNPKGLPADPPMGPRAASIEEFLDAAKAQIAVELTTLDPSTGEPATSHIRAAFARGMHVVTANKGPIAHAYAALRDEAARAGLGFRFESSVMDGAPVFNLWRYTLPGVKVNGFTGALNSTSKVVIQTMEQGGVFRRGPREGPRHGGHRSRRNLRHRRLGFGRQDGRAGQRAAGCTRDAAAGWRRAASRGSPRRASRNWRGRARRCD